MTINIHYSYNQLSIAGGAKWQVPGGWEVTTRGNPIWADRQLLLYINLTSHSDRTVKRGGHFFVTDRQTDRQLLLYINHHCRHHHHHSEVSFMLASI